MLDKALVGYYFSNTKGKPNFPNYLKGNKSTAKTIA
jgi:hypothetical protein